jgi:hypothetical protein
MILAGIHCVCYQSYKLEQLIPRKQSFTSYGNVTEQINKLAIAGIHRKQMKNYWINFIWCKGTALVAEHYGLGQNDQVRPCAFHVLYPNILYTVPLLYTPEKISRPYISQCDKHTGNVL